MAVYPSMGQLDCDASKWMGYCNRYGYGVAARGIPGRVASEIVEG